MKALAYDLIQLYKAHDQGGSFTSRQNRKDMLLLMAGQLHDMGFKKMRARDIGGRHVNRLVTLWNEQGKTAGVMKNRMVVVRWWANKVGRGHVVAKRNEFYGIPTRPLNKVSRAVELNDALLEGIDGPYRDRICASLHLQRYLGLRTEESLKVRPYQAVERDEGGLITRVNMRGSWCKNGRPRSLPIRTDKQREVLEQATQIAGRGSMIPDHLSYVKYLRKFRYRCNKVGLTRFHGLRHRYAQQRYRELTGSLPPNCDGPLESWAVDDRARRVISEELGHGRKNVTSAYLGPASRFKKSQQRKTGN